MSPIGLLILAVLVPYVLVAVFRPHLALALVLLMFPLEQLLQASMPHFARYPALFNYIVIVTVLGALGWRLVRDQGFVLAGALNSVSVLTLTLYAAVGVSVLYSLSRITAFDGVSSSLPYWLLLLVLAPLLPSSLEDVGKAMRAVALMGTFLLVVALLNPTTMIYRSRLVIFSPYLVGDHAYGNTLELGKMAGLVAIAAALHGTKRIGLTSVVRPALVVLGLGLALITARGQFLGAVVVIVGLYPFAKQVRNLNHFLATAFGLALLGGLVMVTVSLFLGESTADRWSSAQFNEGIAARTYVWLSLLGQMPSHPYSFFIGLGTAASAAATGMEGELNSYPHNLIIQLIGEHGLVGVLLFAAICVGLYRHCRTAWGVVREDPSRRATLVALWAFCGYSLLLMLKQGSFALMPEPFWLFMLAARVCVLIRQQANAEADLEAYSEGTAVQPALQPA